MRVQAPGLRERGKHPIDKSWQKKASSDEHAVRDARRSRSDANIGLAMGGASKLVAFDIDGDRGRASWAALEREADATAPQTLTSRSGRIDGGEHRIFTVPDSFDWRKVKNRVGMREGVDVRADGGQIVVAPSRHKSGARYTWSNRVPIAPMPEWLYEAITAPVPRAERARATSNASRDVAKRDTTTTGGSRYFETVLTNACRDIAATGEGQRNETLFRKSCSVLEYVVGMGLERSGPTTELEAAARECGLSSGEARKTLAAAWDKVKDGPGKVPPARPLRVVANMVGSHSSDPPDDATTEVLSRLSVNGENRPRKTLSNVAILLEHHPAWVGVLGFDEFRGEVSKRSPAPAAVALGHRAEPAGTWLDVDALRAVAWLETEIGVDAPRGMVEEAAELVARAHPFHPVRDFFSSLTWDGTRRLDAWLVTYAGADDNDYTRGVGVRWLISAVARTFEPGCQVDCIPVLEGKQGSKKSSLLRCLMPRREWFSELGTVGDKDTLQGLRGKLLLEMAELASLKGRSREKTKEFLTTHVDTYRPSYGRRAIDVPRQCVFAATTNDQHYLEDPTGHRRFWPVKVRAADVEAIARDRDQLWAEAVHRYRAGEAWHVDTEELRALCEAEQTERELGDSWDEELRAWLARPVVLERTATGVEGRVVDVSSGVLLKDALRGILGPDATKAPKSVEMRLAECFRRLGYERARAGETRQRVWRKKAGDQPDPRTTHDPKLSVSAERAALYAGSPRSLPSVCKQVDQVGQVGTGLRNKARQADPPPSADLPKEGHNADSGTALCAEHERQAPTLADLDLPDSFFDGPEVGQTGERLDHPDAAELSPCTCMAGPGEEHAGWCASLEQGAAE